MLEGIGLLLARKAGNQSCPLPRRQLTGMQVQDAKHVLAGISGHGVSWSVGRHARADATLYSEYAGQPLTNQDPEGPVTKN
jgi:hypothetical protein